MTMLLSAAKAHVLVLSSLGLKYIPNCFGGD